MTGRGCAGWGGHGGSFADNVIPVIPVVPLGMVVTKVVPLVVMLGAVAYSYRRASLARTAQVGNAVVSSKARLLVKKERW